MSLDFNYDENKPTTILDEKSGVLKPKLDPNKKVTVLSTIILKKPDNGNNTKQENKRNVICENEKLTQNDEVTNLSQVRKIPENTASHDLRESNLFGNEVDVYEIRSKDSDRVKIDTRKRDENKENNNYTTAEIKKLLNKSF